MRDHVTLTEAARMADTDTPPVPRVLLGLDADGHPLWWSPTTHGNLLTVSSTGAGRTTLTRSLTAQLARLSPAPDDVLLPAPDRRSAYAGALADVAPITPDITGTTTVRTDPRIGHWAITVIDGVGGREWLSLEAAADEAADTVGQVNVVSGIHPHAVADALEGLAETVAFRTLAHQRGATAPGGPYRFLVLDTLVRADDLTPEAVDDLTRIMVDGPTVGVYTVDARGVHAPHDLTPYGLVAIAGLPPAVIRRLELGPELSATPRGRWAVRNLRVDGPWVPVQGVHAPDDHADLAAFLAS
ncbi:hypothetical protein ABZ644_25660 [Nocardiopsis alba]|uniref:hypothetical protein n=1 Tax=Nocardiopsis alba TaxID=53437 RepID=UPI0033CEA2F2